MTKPKNTEAKHTPGPWWFAQHDEYGRYTVGQGDVAIFRTITQGDSGPGEAPITQARDEHQKANARLIAAAPELLAACEAAAQVIFGGPGERLESGDVERARELLRAALAKAGVR